MDCNEKVYELIKELSREQTIYFGITCVTRVLHLYKLFDESEDSKYVESIIPKKERYNTIISVVDYIKKGKRYDSSKIEQYIEKLETLVPDDEDVGGGVEASVAGYIITSIIAILEFIQGDKESIFWCSDSMIESLNQMKLDELYEKYPDFSDEKIEELVNIIFEKEVEIEIEIIDMIKNNVAEKMLEEFILRNRFHI
jgi:hypothetical protein